MIQLAPQHEEFINRQVASGVFGSREEVIDAGIALLKQKAELIDRIEEARRQLDEGEYTEYSEDELVLRFEKLKQRAKNRLK